MDQAVNVLALGIAREGPAWIMAALTVVVGAMIMLKGLPTWQAFLDRRAATEEAREQRKSRESEERARTEGQWIQAIDRSNDVSERAVAALDASTQVIDRLSRKLDADAQQSERLESKLDEACTNIVIIKERISK